MESASSFETLSHGPEAPPSAEGPSALSEKIMVGDTRILRHCEINCCSTVTLKVTETLH